LGVFRDGAWHPYIHTTWPNCRVQQQKYIFLYPTIAIIESQGIF